MCWSFIRRKILNAKVPLADVQAILATIDVDSDGCISVREFVDAIKQIVNFNNIVNERQ